MIKKIVIAVTALTVLLLVTVGVFVAVGWSQDSFTYDTEVLVQAPIEQCWAVFTDPGRATEWLPGLVSVERLRGAHLEVGSEWRMTFEEEGRRIAMKETVTKVEAPRVYSFDLDNDYFSGSTEVRLERAADGTIIRSHNVVAGKSLALRSVLFLTRGAMARAGTSTYLQLKDVIQSTSEASKNELEDQ